MSTTLSDGDERTRFERDGFLVIENAPPESMIVELTKAADQVGPADDFLGKDDRPLELIDWHNTFPKVFGVLGWNIHSYYTQVIITPPLSVEGSRKKPAILILNLPSDCAH